VTFDSVRVLNLALNLSAGTAPRGAEWTRKEATVFLHPKRVAATNAYVKNGPEDRAPSFKWDFVGRVDVAGPATAKKKGRAASAMAKIAKAGK
jgi:hypothetical protein